MFSHFVSRIELLRHPNLYGIQRLHNNILKTLMHFATTAVKLWASIPQRHSHAVFPPFIAFYLISAGSWENSNRFFDSLFVERDELKILKTIPFHKDCRVSVSKMEVVSSLMQSVILRRIKHYRHYRTIFADDVDSITHSYIHC
jgi:hypothetical protein